MEKDKKKVTFGISLGVFIGLMLIMSVGVLVFKINIISLLIIALIGVCMVTHFLGYPLDEMLGAMSESIHKSAVSLVFFLIIGLLIAAWILSGTVPALIYYGLKLINPGVLLPVGFLVCCITSFGTGTSWGTIGTVGIALLGMGTSMSIPTPILAGMIISGASFGDYLSPLSDTTILASSNAGVKVYDHVKSMALTGLPSLVIVTIVFAVIGLRYSGEFDKTVISGILGGIESNFNLGFIVFVPFIVVMVLSFMRYSSIPTLLIGVGLGIIIAIFYQGMSVADVLNSMDNGVNMETKNEMVDILVNRGGIKSMTSTFTLAFIALLISGVVEEIGYLKVIVERLLRGDISVGRISLMTYLTSLMGCIVMAEVYLTIIMNAAMYKNSYDERNIDRAVMSRMLEQGGTLSGFLIPWTTSAAFAQGALAVSAGQYAPYSIYLWLTPLITIVCAYLGIGLPNKNKKNRKSKQINKISM